ncbi:MAG TPA: glycine betaine ABC transporter substrate-binding protein, partial [Acidimicrobiales bacterium]|nr:glycine betaine ABC transporter substrate-binding protein [Acidimicrobiales bacterium]
MRIPRTLISSITVGALLLLGSASLASATASPRTAVRHAVGTITIGTENFPEEVILGNLYNDALQNAGYSTKLKANLGPRASVEAAFAKSQLDLVPEYAGSLLIFLKPNAGAAADTISTDIAALNTQLSKIKATTL